jgi:hypothetical protein
LQATALARRSPEQVRDILIEAGYDEVLRVDGRWPFGEA